ncbi:TFIIE alpha subunit [Dictyocaulus viviparus]|uniref:TFIIE alpha subunit n=1 Tax=Dictyocaulus viviparus TaxID=29172 RepID=A0A0D8XSI4_DICVI|nr:TFIIE alpha subunit [Dictyocaulus viviparus]
MTSNASSTAGDTKGPEVTVVTEVPPSLHRALLLMTKNFFSKEHYLVVYYIMRAVCIREENLRNRLNFDQKQLRQLLVALKNEKLVKDRLLQQKNETGRNVSIIFYFINYRAIINVLKYKIDHMRQMLEAREKNELQKANYKCEQCGAQYEDMDIDRIFDPQTGTLKCWRCQGDVTQDITGGPTQVTRTLLARFNEQMLPLFAAIRELAGIQLAPHLLEPDINQYLADEDKAAEPQQQLLDFSSVAGGPRAQLGGTAHSYSSGPSIKYANADQITVDLNSDVNSKPVEEAKVVPTWLQDDAIGDNERDIIAETLDVDNEVLPHASSSVSLSLMAELENVQEPPEKRARSNEQDNNNSEEENEDEDEEEMVSVSGKMIPLSEVTSEMVAQMTDKERDRYAAIMQENLYY